MLEDAREDVLGRRVCEALRGFQRQPDAKKEEGHTHTHTEGFAYAFALCLLFFLNKKHPKPSFRSYFLNHNVIKNHPTLRLLLKSKQHPNTMVVI